MKQLVTLSDAAHHAVFHVTSHQVEIGRRQDSQGHAGLRQTLGAALEEFGRRCRQFGYVSDRDASAIAKLVGKFAHIEKIEVIGIGSEIEVHVDVDVEGTGDLKNTIDLPVRIRVRVGRSAYDRAAALERRNHQLVGAGIVE